MKQDIIIIGGGASGLMLASLLPKNRAIIIENNPKLGAKISISGGGACNITNTLMDSKYYNGDSKFVSSIINKFDEKSLINWLKDRGLRPIIRKKTQYFCNKNSNEILDIFKRESKKQNIILNQKVLSVTKRDNIFYVKTQNKTYTSHILVVASGGKSFPLLGATSIGYDIALSFNHKINPISPALVGLTVQKEQFFFKELSGLSTKVNIKVEDKIVSGDLLFAHKGLSGPAILDTSLYWKKGKIEIDFLPNFDFELIKNSKKNISSILPLSKRLTKSFLIQLQLMDKPCNTLTNFDINKLKSLRHYSFSPAGNFGYSKAEVTNGGILTDEVYSNSMMSKLEKNLYFIGEVLDVTGNLGGYNFQWAFSSAYSCAKSLK